MDNAARNDLQRRAAAGDAEAQFVLGQQFESEAQTNPARGWYARAAKAGHAAGLRALAVSLLTAAPYDIENGLRMVRLAGEHGDAEALRVCAALAAQDTNLANSWDAALDFLQQSAERGAILSQAELALLADAPVAGAPGDLRAKVDMARWLTAPATAALSRDPRITVIENFTTPAVCDWLVARARPMIERAKVYDPLTGKASVENHRTNSAANFDIARWDLVLVSLRTRIAALAGLPTFCLEHPMVLHYSVGQEFEPHFDFLDPDMPALVPEIRGKGQRVATFLVYLNDGYEGAETQFVDLGLSYKGRKGDALLFWNVDATGAPDRRMRHAGLPPSAGEKWILSQWIREEKPAAAGPLSVHRG